MTKSEKFTASDLRRHYRKNDNGHFFDRKTMQWFGDTMQNFRLRGPMEKVDIHGEIHQVYELYRRKAVRFMECDVGKDTTHYFDTMTYKQIHGIKD